MSRAIVTVDFQTSCTKAPTAGTARSNTAPAWKLLRKANISMRRNALKAAAATIGRRIKVRNEATTITRRLIATRKGVENSRGVPFWVRASIALIIISEPGMTPSGVL